MPRVWKYHLYEMYQLHGSDFYLNFTLGDELHKSNIVFSHFSHFLA